MKPILFNTPMTQALLEGRKSVTRRKIPKDWFGLEDHDNDIPNTLTFPDEYGDYHNAVDLCRYQVGDVLYVRETFRYVSIGEVDYFGECMWDDEVVQFRASQDEFNKEYEDFIGEYHEWKPSIHMPKKLARIFLKVINVRVERLQDITEEQAIKEGVKTHSLVDIFQKPKSHVYGDSCRDYAIQAFEDLWNSTVKKDDIDRYGWETNPWVWVIEFERVVI